MQMARSVSGSDAPPVGRMPDVFIVGAPGCGTTFMHEELGRHPAIFMSEPKEPSYFCPDLDSGSEIDGRIFTRDLATYLALFAGARPDQRAGESSPFYLYSRVAAERIREASADARIVIMLRAPADMIHYLHARKYLVGSEDLERFEDALDAEADRREGRRLPRNAWNVTSLQYRAVGRYAEQVERYLRVFPAERVRVIVFEEFRDDPRAAYVETLRFLGVDATIVPPLERVNPTRVVRSRLLHRLLLTPAARNAFHRHAPDALRRATRAVIDRVNTRAERRVLDPALRRQLQLEFRPDIERLGELLGRDLVSLWG
jgi:hypothetical protein